MLGIGAAMRSTTPSHLSLLLATALMVAACSDPDTSPVTPNLDGSPGDAEAGTDAAPDVLVEDVTADVTADVTPDVPSDGPGEAEPDVTVEDGPADADQDAGDTWVELGPGVWVTPPRPAPGDTLRIRYEGALVSGTNVVMHYGYNGWNEVAGTGATGVDDGTSNLDYFLDLPLTPDAGSHVGEVVLPSGARAIHMVFRATVAGSESWDNHAQRDFNLGLQFPYLGPFLTIEPGASASEHAVVHFHTGMRCEAYVEVGTGSPSTTVTGTVGFMHHVPLPGLSPDTVYSYRVGCKGLPPSDTFTFRTAPAASPSLTFAVASDAQDNGEWGRWAEVAEAIEARNPSLVVFAGDLAWNDKPGLWWTFFDGGRSLLAGRPLLAVPGNHDTPTVGTHPDTGTFAWLFGLDAPGKALTRSLSFGPASFVLMSTETPGDFAVGATQYAWCQQQLAGMAARPWVFAVLHAPQYNAGVRHMGEQGTFRDLTGLFDGVVDWSFSGHEHLYQRMKPMRYNGVVAPSGAYGRGAQDGVGYVVLPPGGAWPESTIVAWDDPKAHYRDRLAYPVPTGQQSTVPSEGGFLMVALQGKQVTMTTYGMGTIQTPGPLHVVDEVSYAKP
jgi:3',5'-cyclic AMP phosphodiesterase CpdA